MKQTDTIGSSTLVKSNQKKTNAIVKSNHLGGYNPSQKLVIYGILIGAVASFVSLAIPNFYTGIGLFNMGHMILSLNTSAGLSVVTFYGFPFPFISSSDVSLSLGYVAFLGNFMTWVLITVSAGLLYKKYKQ